jgi:hypothetical protein
MAPAPQVQDRDLAFNAYPAAPAMKGHTMTSRGSCHCGRIAFEVEGEPSTVLACNCSMCQRKGSLLWFVPRDKLSLLTPEGNASTYEFNKHVIKHRFCPTCGIHPYGEGTDPSGKGMAAINARCLEDFELSALEVEHFDGRAY